MLLEKCLIYLMETTTIVLVVSTAMVGVKHTLYLENWVHLLPHILTLFVQVLFMAAHQL